MDFIADLTGVGKPEGDPGAVRVAANRLSGVADVLDGTVRDIDATVRQAEGGWDGEAHQSFQGTGDALRTMAVGVAPAMREAAGALNVYAAKLEDAQQRWENVRNGAILGRVEGLVKPTTALGGVVAEAEEAAADARAASAALAGELRALADRAAPLPAGVTPPTHQPDNGTWLENWVDRAWSDPLGAAGEWYGELFGGIGDTLKGWWDLALMGARLNPTYITVDPHGYLQNLQMVSAMGVGMYKVFSPQYATVDPQGALDARLAFVSAMVGWDTLKTGNAPRWMGQMVPDAILAAATAGAGGAASAGAGAAARGAGAAARGARGLGALRRTFGAGGRAGRELAETAAEAVVRQSGRPKPDWLRQMEEGTAWHRQVQQEYVDRGGQVATELYIKDPTSGGYRRVDIYDASQEEIISLKNTQLSEIAEDTAKNYLRELDTNYPAGREIADVPSTPEWARGEVLEGQPVLVVPEQTGPVPQAVIDYALERDIIIRDVTGKQLTP